MPDSIIFMSGSQTEDSFPFGRFLPPISSGVISSWLQSNFPPGSWIIDPFCAYPLLTIEAASAGYRVLAASNNPIERFLLELLCQPPTPAELRSVLADLAAMSKGAERIEPYIRSLYYTQCPHCGETIEALAFIWDRQSQKPILRQLNCPICHIQGEYPVTLADQEKAEQHASKGLHWFRALERVAPMNDPDREHAQDAMEAYLPRSVEALFTLVNRLDHFSKPRQRLLAALFLPVFDLANSLWAYPSTNSRPKQLNKPAKFMEVNIWHALEQTIDTWANIFESRNQENYPIPIHKFPELISEGGGITVYDGRLKDLVLAHQDPKLKEILSAVDLKAGFAAIPRPNQAYWSLSTLWAGWLWGSEMTESFKSVLRRRRYDWSWHCTALTSAFNSLSIILKDQIPFLGISGEGEPGLVSATLLAGAVNGFHLQGIATRQESRQIQVHWQRNKSLTHKLDSMPSQFQEMTARIGNQSLHKYIKQRAEPVSYAQLHTVMLAQVLRSPEFQLPVDFSPAELLSMVQSTLQHTTMQDPALIHMGGGERSIDSGKWFLQTQDSGLDHTISLETPLMDRVEMDIVRYLQDHPGCTTREVDQELCIKYSGFLTPRKELTESCLQSYGEASQDEPSKWTLRDQDTPVNRHADLRDLSHRLEQIGIENGYSVMHTQPIASTQRPALLWRAPNNRASYLFYITASAILLPVMARLQSYFKMHPDELSQKQIFVIPGGRSNLIQYKMDQNPYLKSQLDSQWRFLKFRSVRKLSESQHPSSASLDQMLSQDPVDKTDPQIPLF